MFRINRFNELMKHFPRAAFDRTVKQLQADKHRKGFTCWRQLVAMVYAQLSAATSLREITVGFNAHTAHHYHLGCKELRRSTLAEANERGNSEVFRTMALMLMQQSQRKLRRDGKALIQLLDSTSFTLKGPAFDAWTSATRTRFTQGMKLHVCFDLEKEVPLDCLLSTPRLNDLEYARNRPAEKDVTYVFDKGYCDYGWWWQLTQQGARFITRFKRNARLEVVSERAIAQAAAGIILRDQQVLLANKYPGGGRRNPYEKPVRRIEVAREGKEPLVLVTNDLKSSALKIADLYKARWQIELFFKWIKQNLCLKTFVGRSENAVRIQIFCALITYLLAHLYVTANRITKSLKEVLDELRSSLFQRPQTELERHRRWRKQRAEFEMRQQGLFV